jgi:copper chaperone NosL
VIARAIAVSSFVMLSACAGSRAPEIAYGVDTCTRCHMQISDRHFAAVLVTRHGRSLGFDSIDCLRAYYAQPGVAADVATLWVADFAHPGILIPAERAQYVDVGASHSPMGETHGWAAFAGAAAASTILGVDSTALRAWTELP